MSDERRVAMSDALRWQREYVAERGSPVAALILTAVLDDLVEAGPLAALLPAEVRFADLPGLRVMAAVHRLALDREAPRLALWLPTVGGRAPQASSDERAFRREVVRLLVERSDALTASMARTPQTNETGRAALLRCALSREDPARPVRLHEIGASAGLNLRADLLPGLPGLEAGPLPSIVLRRGCDLAPVDVTTPEGRALLGSYVWVDDVDRFRRLARAIDIARQVPVDVLQMDAADLVAAMTIEPGATTVLWHSAMWMYLPEATRAAVDSRLAELGQTASAEAPLVRAAWEWDAEASTDALFELVVTRWDGSREDGRPHVVARGRSHGQQVTLVSP